MGAKKRRIKDNTYFLYALSLSIKRKSVEQLASIFLGIQLRNSQLRLAPRRSCMRRRAQLWRQRLHQQLVESILRLASVRFAIAQTYATGTPQFVEQNLHERSVENTKPLGQFGHFQGFKDRWPVFCAFAARCTSAIQEASYVATNKQQVNELRSFAYLFFHLSYNHCTRLLGTERRIQKQTDSSYEKNAGISLPVARADKGAQEFGRQWICTFYLPPTRILQSLRNKLWVWVRHFCWFRFAWKHVEAHLPQFDARWHLIKMRIIPKLNLDHQ